MSPKTKIFFANSVGPGEAAQNRPPHLKRHTVKKYVDFTVKYLATSCRSILRASACRTFLEIKNGRVMLTDNTRKYLLGFKGYMTKSNTCLFTTALCPIPENVYGRP